MTNPFAKPATVGQVLLGSLCWVAGCLGCFGGSLYGASTLWPTGDTAVYPVLGIASLICGLMWQRVLTVGWRVLGAQKTSALVFAASLWLLLLTVLFVLSVLLLGFALLVLLS